MTRVGHGPYRAAIIGHTGKGGYGHQLDLAVLDLENVEIVAVADPDERGRNSAQGRTGASVAYPDYREMLTHERPDLVVIAPHWLEDRVPMVEAAAGVGSHVFIEKPLARTVAEADRMLSACDREGVKLAVALPSRLDPATLRAQALVREGVIGELRLVRGYGKMDHRGGQEDLVVLGPHVIDLMRLFAGDARWASAEILAGSCLADEAAERDGSLGMGTIAGDGLRATFGFDGGVIGLYESFAGVGRTDDHFGVDLVGETGKLSLRGGWEKRLFRYRYSYGHPGAEDDGWEEVEVRSCEPRDELMGGGQAQATLAQKRSLHRLTRDLIAAIEGDREPSSSGRRGRAALELVEASALAHRRGGRVTLPL